MVHGCLQLQGDAVSTVCSPLHLHSLRASSVLQPEFIVTCILMTSVHVCTAKTTRDIKGCVSNLDSFWLRAVWIHPLVTVISKKRFLHCFWHVSVEEDIPLGKQSQCNRSHSQSSHLYMKELTSFQEHPGPQVLCGSCYCSVLF